MFRKRTIAIILICVLSFFSLAGAKEQSSLEISAAGAVLMESSTGQVLYEKDSRTERPIASVTKIMTVLLIMEAITEGKLTYNEMVTVGEYAAKMGGSQIYLEVGEQMSVEDLLKAILVSSANDACAAMAEHLCGSAEVFVERMNQRAQELGMENTHFVNTNGLDTQQHYSSAYDVALMSRELLRHQDVKRFTTIWQDTLRNGAFGLANTNKLIRFYEGATGLKTGYTSTAKHCLSASAEKQGMELIAVVLEAPSSNDRFNDAKKLLDYGFSNFAIVKGISAGEEWGTIKIENGKSDMVRLCAETDFYLLDKKTEQSELSQIPELPESILAPVEKGQILGTLKFFKGETEMGSVSLIAAEEVRKKNYGDVLWRMLSLWFCYAG